MTDFSVSTHPATLDFESVSDVWSVDLPHQCDEWNVASGDKAEALAQLAQFIADAQEALAKLQALEACPHEWFDDGVEFTASNAGTERRFRCRICDAAVLRVVDRSTAAPWFAEEYYRSAKSEG